MRLLILGLGTAGSRIADAIMRPSGRSSRCSSVHAIAVDNDPAVLDSLEYVRNSSRFYFPKDNIKSPELLTTKFTIEEVKATLRTIDSSGHDAVLLCAGLGGGLIDLVPHMVSIIRETMFEPIFGLITLPSKDEGEERLTEAARHVRMINSLLDGIFIFDNEICLEKAKSQIENATQQKGSALSEKFWIPGTAEKTGSDPYDLVNREIAHRISLLIHAGDVQDTAPQMVLDTREILNTITGMGMITIGYSEEPLQEKTRPSLFWQKEESIVNRQERAGRIVRLAERAVFRDMSAYCDISTARKALILLIGPEEELSMKGFMAVRKWIDETIDGFELRSGDSPLSARYGAHHIGVLILLAGLSNIPKVQELDHLLEEE
ncbi:MAG TPA: hypothetical protein VN372_11100 [Methanospirillum sp.]|nr:hypothetical protein [Methanospirillum sp.]